MQLRLSRFVVVFVLFALLCPIVAQTVMPNDRPLLGFDRASTAAERALEARFDATLNPERPARVDEASVRASTSPGFALR